MNWETPVLLIFLLVFSFACFVVTDDHSYVDSKGVKHYVLTQAFSKDELVKSTQTNILFLKYDDPWEPVMVLESFVVGVLGFLLFVVLTDCTKNYKSAILFFESFKCRLENQILTSGFFKKILKKYFFGTVDGKKSKKLIGTLLPAILLLPVFFAYAQQTYLLEGSDAPNISESINSPPLLSPISIFDSPAISDSANIPDRTAPISAGDTPAISEYSSIPSLTAPLSLSDTIVPSENTAAILTPKISINDISLAEGYSGTTTFSFTVTKSGDTSLSSSVTYQTASGTATSSSDYASSSGTVLFAPGETTKSILITVYADTTLESDETFFVNLSNCSLCTIVDSQGVGTILNDDVALLVITAPTNVQANTDSGVCTANPSLGTATTTGGQAPITITNNKPAKFQLGATTVTWTATDSYVVPNTSSANQLITIVDNQNPSITAPPNLTVNENVLGGWSGSLGTPSTSDNCPGITVTNNAPAKFPLGTTTVTWTATDGSGKQSTATQSVTVNKALTSTALSSSANPAKVKTNVTFTAKVSSVVSATGTPTGTVTFTIDAGSKTTVTLSSGTASLTRNNLTIGTHTIVATYNGDADHLSSTSTTLSQSITK